MDSAHWLPASAAAAVACRGGVYVCIESDAALLAWQSRCVIRQEHPDLPQEEKPQAALNWNLLQLKKREKRKTEARGSREETNKRELLFFREMFGMFSITRGNLSLSSSLFRE